MEACDGDDFNGATCKIYGFDSGQLRCTGQCTIDTGNCQHTPPPPPPTWLQNVHPIGGPRGSEHAVAINGKVIAIVGAFGADLNAAAYDSEAMTPIGSTVTLSVPRGESQDVTLGDIFLAPVGGNFLIATYHVGEPMTSLFLFTAGKPLRGPVAKVAGRPIFIGGHASGALLGTTAGFIRLGTDGKPVGSLKPLFEVATWGEALHGAVVPVTGGWLAAVAVRQGAETQARLDVARVSATGELTRKRAAETISDAFAPLKLLSNGSQAFVAYLKSNALFLAPVRADGSLGLAIHLGDGGFNRVLSADADATALTVWASSARGDITRFRVPTAGGAVDRAELTPDSPYTSEVAVAQHGLLSAVFENPTTRDVLLYRSPAAPVTGSDQQGPADAQ